VRHDRVRELAQETGLDSSAGAGSSASAGAGADELTGPGQSGLPEQCEGATTERETSNCSRIRCTRTPAWAAVNPRAVARSVLDR
jgi:hypothetical protein